jgi:hypothetical protein
MSETTTTIPTSGHAGFDFEAAIVAAFESMLDTLDNDGLLTHEAPAWDAVETAAADVRSADQYLYGDGWRDDPQDERASVSAVEGQARDAANRLVETWSALTLGMQSARVESAGREGVRVVITDAR